MQSKYRSEIDGLRAIAIVAVVIYHAAFVLYERPLMAGGFLGVDVFFVISGYLIARIILKEIEEKKFSYRSFCERRIRRILPALFLVMIASFPLAWIYMLPGAFISYAYSLVSSLGFSANFWFANDISYADDARNMKPFLHAWSLAVEEQFYIIFPSVLLLLKRFVSRATILNLVLCLGIALSLFWAQILSSLEPDQSFYLLPTRAWELLAGVLLANIERSHPISENKEDHSLLPIVGIVLVLFSMFYLNDNTTHPGFATVPVIIGTMLLIRYSGGKDTVSRVLKSKIMVGVGLISYSLYLWHFPIFAFAHIGDWSNSVTDKLELIALSVLLSVISYSFVEQPFRKKDVISTRRCLWILSAAALTVFLCALLTISQNGFEQRMPQIIQKSYVTEPWFKMKNEAGQNCYGTYGKKDFCSFSKDGNNETLIVIGDSNIESFSHILTPKVMDAGFNVVTMNSSACYFMPGFYSVEDHRVREVENQPCDVEFQERRIENIQKHPNATILIGGGLDEYLTLDGYSFRSSSGNADMRDNYQMHVQKLLDQGYTILQMAPMPRFGKHVSQTILNHKIHYPNITDDVVKTILSYDTAYFDQYTKSAMDILHSIQHPNYKIIYPHVLTCNTILESTCVSNDAENLFIFDYNHPTDVAGEMISEMIVDALKQRP